MSAALTVAVVSPRAWPPADDVTRHAAAEAAALAARGHAVTVLAPSADRRAIAEGRALLAAAASGEAGALLAAPGTMRVIAVARALPTAPRRRLGGPLDLAGALETALSATPFDVVHLHEPLAPSPALAALRYARGATAATFHRADQLAGVAFLRPLVDRALGRVGRRIVTGEHARRALAGILPGDYAVVPPGVDTTLFSPPPSEPPGAPGLALVARGRDRVGLRFGLTILRAPEAEAVGPVRVIGPADAPWRTRAAVPKALRERVRAEADPGPAGRAEAFAAARIVVLATPEDAAGPALREAMAAGCAVLAPRCPPADEALRHGADGLILPPFSREAWSEALAELAGDPARRGALGRAAAASARARGWDAVAADLEDAYRATLAAGVAPAAAEARVRADLRVRPDPGVDPAELVAACTEAGLGAVAVAAPGGIGPALAAARAAPEGLAVIVGQEIATTEGALVGLFLSEAVADGLAPEEAARAVRRQGGAVLVPHPGAAEPPPPEVLRRLGEAVDCHELVSGGGADEGPGPAGLARRLGLLGTAGSGARRPAEVGAAVTELRPFHGAADFLEALAGARLLRPGARGRRGRARGPETGRGRSRGGPGKEERRR